jgi:hypothetical protein
MGYKSVIISPQMSFFAQLLTAKINLPQQQLVKNLVTKSAK